MWTAVCDNLPQKTEYVLVYASGAMACKVYDKDKNGFQNDIRDCFNMGGITHWMSLPDKPKLEKKLMLVDEDLAKKLIYEYGEDRIRLTD